MTWPSTRTAAFDQVRNVSGTAWQMLATLGFMIMIGLVGSVWLPWIVDLVNSAAV